MFHLPILHAHDLVHVDVLVVVIVVVVVIVIVVIVIIAVDGRHQVDDGVEQGHGEGQKGQLRVYVSPQTRGKGLLVLLECSAVEEKTPVCFSSSVQNTIIQDARADNNK